MLHFIYLFNKYRYLIFSTRSVLSVFLSSKCSLFHNGNLFGSCIIHILYTECAKIKKKNNSGAKRLTLDTFMIQGLPWKVRVDADAKERSGCGSAANAQKPAVEVQFCLYSLRVAMSASYVNSKIACNISPLLHSIAGLGCTPYDLSCSGTELSSTCREV